MPRPRKPCQYGVGGQTCERPSTTKRPRPSGWRTWDVCKLHAAFLDRLRTNIAKHKTLLTRLADDA